MKLHTVFITHNRLELTQRALDSYDDTITLPHTYVVVDNASTDGTAQWLEFVEHERICLPENRYPGFAANMGWQLAPPDATHLHRADNDFIFLPGWCREVEKRFRQPELGQLGMRTNEEELFNLINVGGNCIIKRELWDQGLRYDERPWPQIAEEVGLGWSEDGLLSPEVKKMGYKWGRVKVPCIQPISSESPDDPYYIRSLGDRGVKM